MIESAKNQDVPEVRWLLRRLSLPLEGVDDYVALTDTFAGMRPADVPGFILAQLAAATAATLVFRWLVPAVPRTTERVVVPRSEISAS